MCTHARSAAGVSLLPFPRSHPRSTSRWGVWRNTSLRATSSPGEGPILVSRCGPGMGAAERTGHLRWRRKREATICVARYGGNQWWSNGPNERQGEGRRLGGGAIASLIGVGLLIIFMIQNTEDVRLDFLVWHFTWPLWLLTIASAALGALIWFGLGISPPPSPKGPSRRPQRMTAVSHRRSAVGGCEAPVRPRARADHRHPGSAVRRHERADRP